MSGMTVYGDPTRDVRAMRNMIDVHVTLTGLPEKEGALRRECARKLLDHCSKMGLSASEVESFKEMAIGILDFRLEDGQDENTAVSYHYRSDGETLNLDSLAGASACLPEGVTADITLTKDGDSVLVSDDPKETGYWNYVSLVAERGNFTKQMLGHRPEGALLPDANSLKEIGEGNFCSKLEELGYMAMAFSSHEAAVAQQKQRQKEAQRIMKQDEEREQEEQQWG